MVVRWRERDIYKKPNVIIGDIIENTYKKGKSYHIYIMLLKWLKTKKTERYKIDKNLKFDLWLTILDRFDSIRWTDK